MIDRRPIWPVMAVASPKIESSSAFVLCKSFVDMNRFTYCTKTIIKKEH